MIKKIIVCFCFCLLCFLPKISSAETVNITGLNTQGMSVEQFKESLLNNGYGYSFIKRIQSDGSFRYIVIPHKNTYPVYLPDTSGKINRFSFKRYDGEKLNSSDETMYSFNGDTKIYNGVTSGMTSSEFFYNTNTKINYEIIELVYPNGVDVPDNAIPPTSALAEDITSFKWTGDGIRIYSPPDGSSIRGYKSKDTSNLKMYDIVVYGKYKSKNGLFDTVDGIKGSIMRSVSVKFGATERSVGEGVGVKNFAWFVEPKNGQEARFRMVLYVPMWKATTSDLTVKTTVKMYDGDKVTFTDTNKSITLLSDNTDENIDKDSPDVEGAIGGSWDDNSGVMDDDFINGSSAPNKPDSINPVDWIVWIIDYIVYFITNLINSLTTIVNTVLKAFADLTNEFTMAIGKFTQIFGMLPSPLPQLIVLSLSVLCMTTIIRLIRG